jgi:hypothetical protein
MVQNQENRHDARIDDNLPARIEDVKYGLVKAIIFNYSSKGSYIETNYPLKPSDEICIGIKNSPYKSCSNSYECYRAMILWRRKSIKSVYKYGYGIRYIFWHDVQNHQEKRLKAKKNFRNHPRKPCCKLILFVSKKQIFEGLLKNISPAGAYIETRDTLTAGGIVMLDILNAKKIDAKIIGKIVRSDINGIGVKFMRISKNTKMADTLKQLL